MLPHTFYTGMLELNTFGKNKFTTVKHIYNESVNLNDSCNVAFDSND